MSRRRLAAALAFVALPLLASDASLHYPVV